MTKREFIRNIRKWHRYLGLILGIQFLLWTIGGLYFSWTNIDEIRGDHIKKQSSFLPVNATYIAPSKFLHDLELKPEALVSLKLTSILKEPFYEVVYLSNTEEKVALVNAINGSVREPLTQKEASTIAKDKLSVDAKITAVEYLTEAGKHHEYRGRPLPAYAITFDAPANTTVYISKDYANVQTLRSNKWRVFDFLWMLHTMDYQGRDNFNNWLLRAFSIFGIFTILSGFSLFFLTSKTLKRSKK